MQVTVEGVLRVAGMAVPHGQVQVLRSGVPSYVLRVRPPGTQGADSVIVKCCRPGSREPEVMQRLSRDLHSVPAVLNVVEGEGFRVMLLEDIGDDRLCDRPDKRSYLEAIAEIAHIHRRFELPVEDEELASLVPVYDSGKWASVVRAGAKGTLCRLEDGTYLAGKVPGARTGRRLVERLAENTLSRVVARMEAPVVPRTLVHGDFHEGNVLIRQASRPAGPRQLAIVDWGDARWDSGLFDLVSLVDVASRMGSLQLVRTEVLDCYLRERPGHSSSGMRRRCVAEWHACFVLRAWDELRWFSETGDDYGERAVRELEIMRAHLLAF